MSVVLVLIWWLRQVENVFMALKCQKKGVESAAGINVPNSFYDFESESMIYLWRVKIKCWNFLGEHKVITLKQQFLGIVLWFFMHLKWPWLLRFFAKML